MVIVPDVTAPDLFTLTISKQITFVACPTVPSATNSTILPEIVGTRKTKVLLTSFKGQSKI